MRTKDRCAPTDWAKTQYRLGTALSMLGKADGGPVEALERSATAYRAALEVQTRDSDPDAWAATQWGLGHVLLVLGDRTQDGDDFSQSVTALEAALPFYDRATAPDDYAQLQNDLGSAYYYLAGSSNDPSLYQKAATAHEAALAVYAALPDRTLWASVEGDLGNARMMQASATSDPDTMAKSVQAYEAALSVMTRDKDADELAAQPDQSGQRAVDAGLLAQRCRLAEALGRHLSQHTERAHPRAGAGTMGPHARRFRPGARHDRGQGAGIGGVRRGDRRQPGAGR